MSQTPEPTNASNHPTTNSGDHTLLWDAAQDPRLAALDAIEVKILNQRGALLLPPRALCDELVGCFFAWVHPILPVIDRARFMRQYRDANNRHSLLLLQAVLLAGSRVCKSRGPDHTAFLFYTRAKALYDAGYERDRTTIVQALVLMGWHWETLEDVTNGIFYWSRVAVTIAQDTGMHRRDEQSRLGRADQRLWKRIWWALFARDRVIAAALGRPVQLDQEESDVQALTEDDFVEEDAPPPDPIHVQFFMHYVKLCEITGRVLLRQQQEHRHHSEAQGRRAPLEDVADIDGALAKWLKGCPEAISWERTRHEYWSGLLHSSFYTTLCLLHCRAAPLDDSESPLQSQYVAAQAADMITLNIETLAAHQQLQYCPVSVVYSLLLALVTHFHQMRSPAHSTRQLAEGRLRTCMSLLRELSQVWSIGKSISALFEAATRCKSPGVFQGRPGYGGTAALGAHRPHKPRQKLPINSKRKYDDMVAGDGLAGGCKPLAVDLSSLPPASSSPGHAQTHRWSTLTVTVGEANRSPPRDQHTYQQDQAYTLPETQTVEEWLQCFGLFLM